jgi:hypothetical protein
MQARRKTQKHIHPALNAVLEFGPTIGFVLVLFFASAAANELV